jgi:hypothetical protein
MKKAPAVGPGLQGETESEKHSPDSAALQIDQRLPAALTARSWNLPEGMPVEEWVSLGKRLVSAEKNVPPCRNVKVEQDRQIVALSKFFT